MNRNDSAFPNLYNDDKLGLTKREYMATAILAGMVPTVGLILADHVERGMCDTAVTLADKLIKALAES